MRPTPRPHHAKLIGCLCAFLSLASACHKKNQKAPAPLRGKWLQSCKALASEGNANATFQDDAYEFNDGHFSRLHTEYSDERCSRVSAIFASNGSYELGGPFGSGAKINASTKQLVVTVKDAEALALWNEKAFCGPEFMALDTPREIRRGDCAGFFDPRLAPDYNIYQVTNDQLTFGQNSLDKNGTSEEARPSELSLVLYKKQ